MTHQAGGVHLSRAAGGRWRGCERDSFECQKLFF